MGEGAGGVRKSNSNAEVCSDQPHGPGRVHQGIGLLDEAWVSEVIGGGTAAMEAKAKD